jgi:hypothetical protein
MLLDGNMEPHLGDIGRAKAAAKNSNGGKDRRVCSR